MLAYFGIMEIIAMVCLLHHAMGEQFYRQWDTIKKQIISPLYFEQSEAENSNLYRDEKLRI